jgi:hypothetical protein
MRLLPAMGYDEYRMRSKDLVIEDATLKLQGLEVVLSMGDQVEPADVIDAVNEICGIHLKVSDVAPDLATKLAPAPQPQMAPGATHTIDEKGNVAPIAPPQALGDNVPGKIKPINPAPRGPPKSFPIPGSPTRTGGQPGVVKPKQVPNVMGGLNGGAKKFEGASAYEIAVNTLTALRKRDFADLAFNMSIINSLDQPGRDSINDVMTGLTFVDPTLDPVGLQELSACTLAIMAGRHDHEH